MDLLTNKDQQYDKKVEELKKLFSNNKDKNTLELLYFNSSARRYPFTGKHYSTHDPAPDLALIN